LHATFGAEVVGGYLHESFVPWDAGALRLAAPIGVSLGNPSGSSLGIYAAPYLESSVMRLFDAGPPRFTWSDAGLHTAAGVGVGGRASLGRLALEIIVRDVKRHRAVFYGEGGAAVGFTYRLSR
jgi:hypothetical protein